MNQRLVKSLQLFNETARSGSMSEAARRLNMTVSAVSQQLHKLEEEIGLALFVRNTRSMSLTEAGELYYEATQAMSKQAEQMQSRLAVLKQQPQGVLKLVAPAGFGGGLLSEPLTSLMEKFPEMGVDLKLTDEPLSLIQHGADLGLCIGPMADSQMIARHLADWSMTLCVAHNHPLAGISKDNLQELEKYCYISHIREQNEVTSLTGPGDQQLHLSQRRVIVNNMQSLIQLVKDGMGYGLLPKPEIQTELDNGQLIELSDGWQLPRYSVYAVTPHRDFVPAKTQTAIDLIKHHFASIEG